MASQALVHGPSAVRAAPMAQAGARAPRRLLMTTDTVGGVWTYSLTLAAGLASAGIEVILAVHGPPPDRAQRAAAAALPNTTLVTSGVELEWRDGRGAPDRAALSALAGLERRFQPDLVHLNGYRDALVDWSVPVVIVAHSCVRSWWRACRSEALPASWAAYGSAVEAALARAASVIAPTHAFLAELEACYGRLPAARVIHNGTTSPVASRQREPVVLTVGRLWDEAKNLRLLERVAADIAWPVQVIGDPPARRGAALDWRGRLPPADVHAAMAGAGIYCAPALYEPFGLAVLEAAARGAPLVLSRIPSLVELWDDAALFVDPHDHETLKVALDRLIGDAALRRQLGAAARRRAGKFGTARMVAAYQDLYAELLATSCAEERRRS